MTKEEVIEMRNICRCGVPNPDMSDPDILKRFQENRPIRILFDNNTIDEADDFIMWDDAHERIIAIHIGNGVSGGGINKSSQYYATGWSKGVACPGENYQILTYPYEIIQGMLVPAIESDLEEVIKGFSDLITDTTEKDAFDKAAKYFIERTIKPLHNIKTYTDSTFKNQESYPPVFNETSKQWEVAPQYKKKVFDPVHGIWKNEDGTPCKLRPNGEPYPDPKSYFTDETTTR